MIFIEFALHLSFKWRNPECCEYKWIQNLFLWKKNFFSSEPYAQDITLFAQCSSWQSLPRCRFIHISISWHTSPMFDDAISNSNYWMTKLCNVWMFSWCHRPGSTSQHRFYHEEILDMSASPQKVPMASFEKNLGRMSHSHEQHDGIVGICNGVLAALCQEP